MGCSDVYCILCGCPIMNPLNIYKYYKKSDVKWLNECITLLSNNTLIQKQIIDDCDMYFENTIYKYFSHNYRFSQIIQVHKVCYELILRNKNIKLKFSDFIYNINGYYILDYINYGSIKKYHTQEFIMKIEEFINDNNVKDLLINPNKNKKNEERILKIFNTLNIRNDRSCPNISAKLFRNNTYLIGNNNLLWKKNNNRWNKVENFVKKFIFIIDEKKFIKNTVPILEKMKFIGYYNDDGIVYNIDFNNLQKDKIKVVITLIGIIENYVKYNKIFENIEGANLQKK